VVGELNTPRYPHVGKMVMACSERAPIEIWNAADIGVKTRDVGLEGSLTHVIKTFVPKSRRKIEMLEGGKEEVVQQLIEKLGKSEGATACKAIAAACRL
jgi:electron transfer flavoprotein beta subunit